MDSANVQGAYQTSWYSSRSNAYSMYELQRAARKPFVSSAVQPHGLARGRRWPHRGRPRLVPTVRVPGTASQQSFFAR